MMRLSHVRRRAIVIPMAVLALLSSLLGPQLAHAKTVADTASNVADTASNCASPPANFDPLNTSDSEMLSYGLPRRPQGTPAEVSSWANEMRHAKYRSCGPSVSLQGIYSTPAVKSSSSGRKAYGSLNWDGYEVTSNTYNEVEGYWIVPSYSVISGIHAAHITWVGLGGDPGTPLWQGGTTEDQTLGYHFWWEMYPTVSIQDFSSPTPRPGDSIYAEADYNVNVSNCSYFVVVDNTTSQYTSKTYCAKPNQSTAEWIDERPSCSTNPLKLYPLENWHRTNNSNDWTLPWSSADARAGTTSKVISGWLYYSLTMYDSQSNTLAYPSGLGSGGNNFLNTYQFYGLDYQC